jgi:site-specific recombinase XerD
MALMRTFDPSFLPKRPASKAKAPPSNSSHKAETKDNTLEQPRHRRGKQAVSRPTRTIGRGKPPASSTSAVLRLQGNATSPADTSGAIGRDDLARWAESYLKAEVIGVQSQNTFDAKRRDLETFLKFFLDVNGHLQISRWSALDTSAFVKHLERSGKKPATINRMLSTLRRFARWAHDTGGADSGSSGGRGLRSEDSPFKAGLPTSKVRELVHEDAQARKLESKEVFALFKAAENLVSTETRSNARPRRNQAILALLFYTGLRVSELVNLKAEQYEGKYLVDVVRKGRVRSRIYVPVECRKLLDEYVSGERLKDYSRMGSRLFLPGSALDQKSPRVAGDRGPLTRRQVHKLLIRIADEANKHRKDKIALHPHRLRHTFGFLVRQKTGSDTETAALLGHSSLKYVGRYVRQTDLERETVLDGIDFQ